MSPLDAVLLLVGAAALGHALLLRSMSRRLGHVPGGDDVPDEALPSVSLVVAGRNEERDIEEAVRSWLRLDLPSLEVIVVDDRSTDGTPEILQRLAAEHPRLVHLRVEHRPEDWLGKCWALQQGANRATGDWLLFSDADVVLDPRALRRVLHHVQSEDIEHLSLLPRIRTESVAQKAFTWLFFQIFLTALGGLGLNADNGRGFVGVGAFALMRRSSYEALGGHEEIRMQVGDDGALARLFVRAGRKHRGHWGFEVAELEWQPGLWATVKGLEKNAFWGLRFSLLALLAGSAVSIATLAPVVAPLVGTPAAWSGFALWLLGLGIAYHGPEARIGERLACVLLHPLSVLLMVVTAWNSAIHVWRHRGIVWRDDHIPMKTLREGLKPVSWWLERAPPNGTH